MSETNDEYNWGNHPDTAVDDNKDKPTLSILAILKGGKLVRVEWSGEVRQISDKTLEGMQSLGINVVDDASNYLFQEGML